MSICHCPKCGSGNYYYDGLFILCNDCDFKEWARDVDGRLENLVEKWRKANEQKQ